LQDADASVENREGATQRAWQPARLNHHVPLDPPSSRLVSGKRGVRRWATSWWSAACSEGRRPEAGAPATNSTCFPR